MAAACMLHSPALRHMYGMWSKCLAFYIVLGMADIDCRGSCESTPAKARVSFVTLTLIACFQHTCEQLKGMAEDAELLSR